MNEPTFNIRLTFVDSLKNGFTTIGGAGWLSLEEQQAAWKKIPALVDGDESDFIADLMDAEGSTLLTSKCVSSETCEALMGEPIAALIARGRENTCYTLGELRAKRPELFI